MCFENSHQSRLLRHFFSLSLIYTIFIIFCVLSKEKKLYRRITWQGRQKENITKSQFLCFGTGHHASGVITGDRLAKRPFWEFRMTKQCTGIEHEEIKENTTTDGFFTKHCVEKNTIPTHFFRSWVLLLHPDRACKKKQKGSHRIKKRLQKWTVRFREATKAISPILYEAYQNARRRIATTEPNHEDTDFLIVTGKYPISD